MTVTAKDIAVYLTADGREPFQEWFESLNAGPVRTAVLARLFRVRLGNLGDHRTVGDGVQELRLDIGPGYRV